MEEAEEENGVTASNAPKTENEVDGYRVPIRELESQLQIRLTVDDGMTALATSNKNKDISANQLSLAGRVKNYMLMDRTVVVESISISSTSLRTQQAVGPLDEGSLLVIKKHSNTENGALSDGTGTDVTSLMPLGRIFEVFGPVSQPLYTIRLPSPPSASKTNKKSPNHRPYKKNSNIQSSNDSEKAEAKEVDEKEVISTDNSNESNVKTIEKEENKGDGDASSDVLSKPETSDETDEAIAMEESLSSPTKDDPVGKKSREQPENGDISQQQLSESVESSQDKEGSRSNVEKTAPSSSHDAKPEKNKVDLWATDGEYAKFLSQNKNIEVYYIQDEAKLIDTGFVMRTSGKGCDASNIYDEEIVNSSEAYYSDDEKEREAKNKKKGVGRKKKQQRNIDRHQQRHNNNSTTFQHNASPRYYGQPPPPPPPQNHRYGQGPASLPQGFHHTSQQHYQQGGVQQPYPTYQYPPQSMFHRQAPGAPPPPPPPPPPPGNNQPYPYQGTRQPPRGPQTTSNMVPPPPPPRNCNEPPAYQY
eukprot:jgi/Psemu1/287422/fgenesh1_pg.190_\